MKKEKNEGILIDRLKNKVSMEFVEWTLERFYPCLNRITPELLQANDEFVYNLLRDFVARSYTTKLIQTMTIKNWYAGIITLSEEDTFFQLSGCKSESLKEIDQKIPNIIVGRNFPYETLNMLLLDKVNALEVLTRDENFSFHSRLLEKDFDYNTFNIIESLLLKKDLTD